MQFNVYWYLEIIWRFLEKPLRNLINQHFVLLQNHFFTEVLYVAELLAMLFFLWTEWML